MTKPKEKKAGPQAAIEAQLEWDAKASQRCAHDVLMENLGATKGEDPEAAEEAGVILEEPADEEVPFRFDVQFGTTYIPIPTEPPAQAEGANRQGRYSSFVTPAGVTKMVWTPG